ncbi:PTS sugar transporter subunit IIB [uncultured Enorma sp.]|uniref:PTS sugar transporter subunit IIB n=1 Tax=uncultured Enorma sp. TaxID=1714346 RepID=UPI002618C07B|nr:PTS sugar transporter subunit IIB [uncultured Enorma sp.]
METKGMENIVLTRVDDRLVHGQVMTSWVKATGANKIMVVDDGVAEDELMKTVLKGVVPSQVKLGIFSVAKAVDRMVKGFKDTDKVIMLVKTPETVWRMQEAGVDFKTLNIGGMGIRSDRTTLYQNIAASESERAAIKSLIDAGCAVTIQITADDSKVDVSKHL